MQIKKAALEISGAAENNSVDNVSLPNVPRHRVEIKICEKISVYSANEELISLIKEANTFPNPKYESNARHGYSNWQTPKTIETFHQTDSLNIPRGFLHDLLKLCEECNTNPVIADCRVENPVTFPKLNGIKLRTYQARAVSQAMQADQGVIVSPTGSGKSLIGLEIIRQRGQKALILVHRSELAKQWITVIKERMKIKAGFIGNGSWTIGDITVAMVQTLAAKENETKALSKDFGLILLDEGHHSPASTFFEVLNQLAAKYRYTLSATPNRRDGLESMIYRGIGPIIAFISKEEVESLGSTVPITVISINTGFNPGPCNSWNEYLATLTANVDRNMRILKLAHPCQGSALILVDRIAHAEQLSDMLTRRNVDHILAHGRMKDRESMMRRIKSAKLTIGTTSLLGEGLDVSIWEVLIMGSPISSEIKLMQAIGRCVRPAKGKENAVVYDLKDDCGFAGSSFNKRFEIYRKHNIWVEFHK